MPYTPSGGTYADWQTAVTSGQYTQWSRILIDVRGITGGTVAGATARGSLEFLWWDSTTPGLMSLTWEEGDTSSYPAELTNASGLSNMAGSFTVTGQVNADGFTDHTATTPLGATYDVLETFNPDDPRSAWYLCNWTGLPVVIESHITDATGHDSMVTREAWTTQVEVDQVTGQVTISFSDVEPALNNAPPSAALQSGAAGTSAWCVDALLRESSFLAWPATRGGTATTWLAASLCESFTPLVGATSAANIVTTINAAKNPFAKYSGMPMPGFAAKTATPGSISTQVQYPFGNYNPSTLGIPFPDPSGTGAFQIEFQAIFTPSPTMLDGPVLTLKFTDPTHLTAITVEIQLEDVSGVMVGQIMVIFDQSAGGGSTVPWTSPMTFTPSVVHNIGIAVQGNPNDVSSTVTVVIDGAETAAFVAHTGAANPTSITALNVSWTAGPNDNPTGNAIYGLQVFADTTISTTLGSAFTPTLFLDPSANTVTSIPVPSDTDTVYTVLQQIAEAEAGWIGQRGAAFSNMTDIEAPTMIFMSRASLVGQTASRGISAANTLMNVASATTGASAAYDGVTVDYTPVTFTRNQMAYQAPAPIVLQPRSTQQLVLTLAQPTTVINAAAGALTLETSDISVSSFTQSGFRASLDSAGVTAAGANAVTGTVTLAGPNTVNVTLTNTSGSTVYLVSPATYVQVPVGTPALWIIGTSATPGSVAYQSFGNVTTTAALTPLVYQPEQNVYRQDPASTQGMASYLYSQLHTPPPLYGEVDIVPDATITVPDLVTVDIPVKDGYAPTSCLVWGSTVTASYDADGGEWSQSLNIRALAPQGLWLLNVSTLNVNTLII